MICLVLKRGAFGESLLHRKAFSLQAAKRRKPFNLFGINLLTFPVMFTGLLLWCSVSVHSIEYTFHYVVPHIVAYSVNVMVSVY